MFSKKEIEVLNHAKEILNSKLVEADCFASPEEARLYCQTALAHKESEVFAVLFLNNRNNLIRYVEMFFGTIDGASVYPREVAKLSLQLNAAAVIFTHNHPSGVAEPSRADEQITRNLVEALRLFDIRVLDHIVVGIANTVSFAERGLL